MQLPQQTDALSRWSVFDYQRRSKATLPAGTDGRCVVELAQVPGNELWLVDRINITCSSSTETTFSLYENTEIDANILEFTDLGNDNVADENAPVQVQPNAPILAIWEGASVGAVGKIRIQFTVLRLAAA